MPENCSEKEIVVIPIGNYEEHSLKLNDYYKDSTGNMQNADLSGAPLGKWIVNEEEIPGKSINVSPVEPLYIDYRYDDSKYCYVSSAPASFYHDNGLVRFETINANSDIDECSVELRSLEKKSFFFNPSQYSPEHGTVAFEYHGQPVTEEIEISDGEVLLYKTAPESGYHSSTDNGEIIVNASKPDITTTAIEDAVKFYPDKEVQVNLPRPVGGEITYRVGTKTLTGNKCKLQSGVIITMDFSYWNGWKQNATDGESYTVSEQEDQTVSINGLDINTELFVESDDHKPTLQVVLTESIPNASFDIIASGISNDTPLSYETRSKKSTVSGKTKISHGWKFRGQAYTPLICLPVNLSLIPTVNMFL